MSKYTLKYLNSPVWFLLFVILTYVLHFIFFHGGYFGYDDMEYSRLAADLTKGAYDHDTQYAYRYGIILPLAASYLTFGINDFANFLIGLLPFLGITMWVMILIKHLDHYAQWMAMIFLCVAPMHLMYVEKPMPDLITELGFFTSFCAMYAEKYKLPGIRFRWQLFVAGIILTILSKETILIFYPYFLLIAIYDLGRGQSRKFWLSAAAGIFSFGVLYLLGSYWFFGDALIRVKSIFAGQYLSPCAYDQLPLAAVLKRIGSQLWVEFIRNMYMIPAIFIILLIRRKDDKVRFLSLSFTSLMLLTNFMSISYTSYVPLCPDPRHFMFILPVGALLVAHGAELSGKISKSDLIIMVVFLLLQLYISIDNIMEQTWWLFCPLACALIAAYFGYRKWMFSFWMVGMMSVFVNNAEYNTTTDYKSQKALNFFTMDSIQHKKYIITDHVNATIGSFHSGYDTTMNTYISFKALDTTALDSDISKYLIMNGMTMYLSNTNWEALPDDIRHCDTIFPKVFENKSGKVYRMK